MPVEWFNDTMDAERAAGRNEGRADERKRLRPLLERLEADITILSSAFGFVEPASLADLRRELRKEV